MRRAAPDRLPRLRREVVTVAEGRTHWKCETCGWEGTVTYPEGAGVYEVIDLIKEAHANDDHQEFDLGVITVKEL